MDIDPRGPRPISPESADGKSRPFHQAILPHGILTISEFERSFSTRLGRTFAESARLMALENFEEACREYSVSGMISEETLARAEQIVAGSTSVYLRGRFPEFIKAVLDAGGEPVQEMRQVADLRLVDSDGNQTFFEIKSPKPNKGQCDEVTLRFLRIHGILGMGAPEVMTYYAMAYNPWGYGSERYSHSFGNSYLDMENQVLLGREFWEYVGGPGEQEELLEIYQEVGREIRSA